MRNFKTADLIGYAIFAALFLAVAGLRPARAADGPAPVQVASNADITNDATQVETVVVSARRRSEDEQNVPISLTALTGDTLSDNGVRNALKLDQLVPSLQVVSFNARNSGALSGLLGDPRTIGVTLHINY